MKKDTASYKTESIIAYSFDMSTKNSTAEHAKIAEDYCLLLRELSVSSVDNMPFLLLQG